MTKFEVGKSYKVTFGEGNNIAVYKVVARTAKFVTLERFGKQKKYKIFTYCGSCESVEIGTLSLEADSVHEEK